MWFKGRRLLSTKRVINSVSYGKTVEDCDQAARGTNTVRAAIGYPDRLCHDEPSRVKALRKRIRELESENEKLRKQDQTTNLPISKA
jgi:hypothetical protein